MSKGGHTIRSVPLNILSQPVSVPAGGPVSAKPTTTDYEPVSTGPSGLDLSAKHDFAGKFRHPQLLERLKDYVREQAQLAGAVVPNDVPTANHAAPISINLDLTTACNYACDHCVDMDILNQPIKFSHDNLLESLRLMSQRGLRSVIVIGGGEPTVYPRFCEIIRFMKSLGLQVAIVSNGSGQKKIEQIADCLDVDDWVRLSLDAAYDHTFTAMHKPKRPITLDEICQPVARIKAINPSFQFGYSFIITWKGASINDTKIVENLDEMLPAAKRAKTSCFDYISFKPFLTRAPENNAEIVGLEETQTQFGRVLARIRQQVETAKKLQTDTFKVIESTNLRVLENGTHAHYTRQPRRCHMQYFRQVLSPLGLYNCPVYRNQPQGKISDKDGYGQPDRFEQTTHSTISLIDRFNATHECKQVTCLYNHVNWWIEDLIRHPDKLDRLQHDPSRQPDFFF